MNIIPFLMQLCDAASGEYWNLKKEDFRGGEGILGISVTSWIRFLRYQGEDGLMKCKCYWISQIFEL